MRAPAIRRANSLPRLRPDVEPEPTVGQRVERRHLRLRLGLERARRDDVDRQDRLERERAVRAHVLCHLPADQDRVGPRAEVLEHADLVLDLRATRDDHERPLDLPEQAPEVPQLLEQEESRVRGQ